MAPRAGRAPARGGERHRSARNLPLAPGLALAPARHDLRGVRSGRLATVGRLLGRPPPRVRRRRARPRRRRRVAPRGAPTTRSPSRRRDGPRPRGVRGDGVDAGPSVPPRRRVTPRGKAVGGGGSRVRRRTVDVPGGTGRGNGVGPAHVTGARPPWLRPRTDAVPRPGDR